MSERPDASVADVKKAIARTLPPSSDFHWVDAEHRWLETNDDWEVEVNQKGAWVFPPDHSFSAYWSWDLSLWEVYDSEGNELPADRMGDFKPDPSWRPDPPLQGNPDLDVM